MEDLTKTIRFYIRYHVFFVYNLMSSGVKSNMNMPVSGLSENRGLVPIQLKYDFN